jgi:gluconolactonase
MFAPPPVIETEVFARLPDKYRKAGAPSAWLDAQLRGAPMHSLLEGPAFDRDGNLYVVDIPFGRLFKVSPAGEFALAAEYDGEPNGLKFHRDGRGFIADHRHGIMVFDPESGAVMPYCDRVRGERFKGVNDLSFAANGDLYFTDQGQSGLQDPSGRVYRLAGDAEPICVIDRIPSPNGLVLSLDEATLFVAVTRMNNVWRVPFMRDGTAAKVGVFVQLSGGVGPDGMALDAEGNLAVCHFGLGTVWLFSATGEPLFRIRSCEGLMTTNLAYGGEDLRDLYITEAESGSILRARLPTPGRAPFSQS